ncbi:MAG: hypothetical protein K6T37_06875 [Acidothermus cellulolyticus]|nr:hypothetical protein [Acidothermus cellulolyticus]
MPIRTAVSDIRRFGAAAIRLNPLAGPALPYFSLRGNHRQPAGNRAQILEIALSYVREFDKPDDPTVVITP